MEETAEEEIGTKRGRRSTVPHQKRIIVTGTDSFIFPCRVRCLGVAGDENPQSRTGQTLCIAVSSDGQIMGNNWIELARRTVHRKYAKHAAIPSGAPAIVAAMKTVPELTYFPPGLLPLVASYVAVDRIFIAGGEELGTEGNVTNSRYGLSAGERRMALDTMDCLSLETGVWGTDFPPMMFEQCGAAVVVVRGQILTFGGLRIFHTHSPHLDTCQTYDPDADVWLPLPPMLTKRFGHCAAEWENKAFVFGGDGLASADECYDPVLNQWSRIAPLTPPRHGAVAVAVPGRGVLVMGGCIFHSRYNPPFIAAGRSGFEMHEPRDCMPLRSVELYHPSTDTWTSVPWTLPKELFDFSAHCIGSVLYIIGGRWRNVWNTRCWCMDLNVDPPSWTLLPEFPFPMHCTSSVLV